MTKYYSETTINSMEQRYRATFINSLGGFKSVSLVGTKNKAGKTNLAIFNSIFHLGANPPLVGMVVRPDSVERHSYENILETGFYTLNHLNQSIFINAHQTSARYKREESEFEKCKLTETYLSDFKAPYVKESSVKVGLLLRDTKRIELNDTIIVIGEIKQVHLEESIISPDGFIDLEAAGSITCSGLDSYHKTERMGRLSYAKPYTWPSFI